MPTETVLAMKCAQCHFDNSQSAKFCAECGAKLRGDPGDRKEAERQLTQLKKRVAELEQQIAARSATEVPQAVTTAPELEVTLGRLLRKIAMILQGEKCVFMIHDPERGELIACKPALGFSEDQIAMLRVPATRGISGEAFRECKPVIVNDAVSDERTLQEHVALLNIKNALTVPLTMERRDEDERLVERATIGVLHVFNKRFGGSFSNEDTMLLTVLARQAAAVIANARLYIKLAEEKEHLEATLQSLVAGVLVVEPDGRVSLINSAAKQIFGSENGAGKPFTEIVADERIRDLIDRTLRQRSEAELEVELSVASVPRIYQAQTALVKGQNEAMMGVVAIFSDITEIRNVERMKTAFVSTVSHELRTPLTAIKGFVRTLLDDEENYFDQDMRREFHQIIDNECDRLKRLVEDLLNVSRIEQGKALQMNWKQFDAVPVIERVVNTQKAQTDRHTVQTDMAADFPKVLADEDKLEQILHNLVQNAIKYSPKGGEVIVKAVFDEESYSISVTDHGLGIPKNMSAKIFERFERVDSRDTREVGGTGIGLYLVKHLVEQHEGRIWVDSEVGEGSTFTFKIPITPKKALDDIARLT